MSKSTTGFLDLPPELRSSIYENVLNDNNTLCVLAPNQRNADLPALCHISRKIRKEFVPMFASQLSVQADIVNFDFRRVTALRTHLFSDFEERISLKPCSINIYVIDMYLSSTHQLRCKQGLQSWLDFVTREGLLGCCQYLVIMLMVPIATGAHRLRGMRAEQVDAGR